MIKSKGYGERAGSFEEEGQGIRRRSAAAKGTKSNVRVNERDKAKVTSMNGLRLICPQGCSNLKDVDVRASLPLPT